MRTYLDYLSDYEDKIMLLELIMDEMNPECGLPADMDRWSNEKISDEEMIQKLLPLCKLLNRLFFDHAPLET